MRLNFILITGLFCIMGLSGCAHKYNIQQYSTIDLNSENKTITVSSSGSPLNNAVNQVLREEGWDMRILTPGKPPETRYLLTMGRGPASFNIILIDLQTTKEVFRYYGNGTLEGITWNLKHILNNRPAK